jgi:hypothetical protein
MNFFEIEFTLIKKEINFNLWNAAGMTNQHRRGMINQLRRSTKSIVKLSPGL